MEIAESQYLGDLALLLPETILRTPREAHVKTVSFKTYLSSSIPLVPSKQRSGRESGVFVICE